MLGRLKCVVLAIAVTFPMILSLTMINVALPNIMLALGMGIEQAQLLSTTSLLAATTSTLLAPHLWQQFGARATVLLSLTLFMIGCLLAAVASTPEVLILARILQGISAGVIQPLTLLIVIPAFPANRRGLAMGLVGVGMLLAPALGPVYAGWVTEHFGWRLLFFSLVPWCLCCVPAAYASLPSRSTSNGKVFDLLGFAMLTGSLSCVVGGLTQHAKGEDLSRDILLAMAAFLGTGFFWRQVSCQSGLIDLTLFLRLDFAFCTIIMFVLGFGIFGSILLVPLFLQTVAGFTPLAAGEFLVPAGLVMAFASPFCGYLCDRVQPSALLAAGLALFALSCFLLAHIDIQSDASMLSAQVTLGRVGLAIIFPAIYAISLYSLPLHQMPQGSSVVNFVRQMGGALGTAALVLAIHSREAAWFSAWTASDASASVFADAQRSLATVLGAGGVETGSTDGLAMNWINEAIGKTASGEAFRDLFRIMGVGFLLCLVPTLVLAFRPIAKRSA